MGWRLRQGEWCVLPDPDQAHDASNFTEAPQGKGKGDDEVKDKDLIDWLRYNVGVSDAAVTAAHLAADRIQELLGEQDSIREAVLREAAENCKTCQCRDEILDLIGEKK